MKKEDSIFIKNICGKENAMKTATEEAMAKGKIDTEMLLNQITDYGFQIMAIKRHLGIELRREEGYSVVKYEDMILRKPKKWYQFWK